MFGISNCGDHELVSKVEQCSIKEHEALVELLLYLAELDQRKLYLGLGYSSLFAYCTKKLKYSEPAAHRRILACRCIREFPQVLGALKDQAVSLTTITIFSKILTAENVTNVLEQVCNRSKDQVEQFVVKFSSPIERKTTPIRAIKPYAARIKPVLVSKPEVLPLLEHSAQSNTSTGPAIPTKPELNRNETQYKISLYIDDGLMQKVNRLKELKPYRTLEELFELVLESYLKRNAPEFREVDLSANSKNPRKRHISAKLRARVLKQDNYTCSYVSHDGTRCNARHDLEIDHIVPFSRGGLTDASNLRTLCSAHNRFEADRLLGAKTMAHYTKNQRKNSARVSDLCFG